PTDLVFSISLATLNFAYGRHYAGCESFGSDLQSREDGENPSRTRRCKGRFFFAKATVENSMGRRRSMVPSQKTGLWAIAAINFDSRFFLHSSSRFGTAAMLESSFPTHNLTPGFRSIYREAFCRAHRRKDRASCFPSNCSSRMYC